MNTHDELSPDTEQRLSAKAAALIADIRARQAADPRFAVSRKEAQAMLGIGPSYELELEAAGELRSYLDGAARRVSVASVYERLVRLAIASHPVDAPAAKARSPSARFKKQARPRTPQELAGLRAGNEKRRLEAEQRRQARTATQQPEQKAAGVPSPPTA